MNIKRSYGEIIEIIVDCLSLNTDDGETWYLPKDLISSILLKDMPEDAVFYPCKFYEDNFVQLDSIPMHIQKINDTKVLVSSQVNYIGLIACILS